MERETHTHIHTQMLRPHETVEKKTHANCRPVEVQLSRTDLLLEL